MDAESIIEVLIRETGISRTEIDEKTEECMKSYQGLLDFNAALLVLAKDLGVNLDLPPPPGPQEVFTTIAEIKEGMKLDAVLGVVRIIDGLHSFVRKSGATGYLFKFLIEDRTGKIQVLAWDTLAQSIEEDEIVEGSLIKIKKPSARLNRMGDLELHFTKKSGYFLNPSGYPEDLLPDELEPQDLPKYIPLESITQEMKKIQVRARVQKIYPLKQFERADGQGRLRKVRIADYTSQKWLLFWNEQVEQAARLRQDDIIAISNIWAKQNSVDPDLIELHFSNYSALEIVVSAESQAEDSEELLEFHPIASLLETKGQGSIKGTIIEILPLRTVNKQDKVLKLRQLVIKDETGVISVVFWERDAETIEDLQVGDKIGLTNIWAKDNTYTQNVEASFTQTSKLIRDLP